MQLSRSWPALLGLSSAVGFAPGVCAQDAPDAEAARAAGYLFHFFSDSDRVHVFSHYSHGELDLSPGSRLSVQLNHERVVIPGISAAPGSAAAVDAITTASRPIANGSRRSNPYADYAKLRNELQADVAFHTGRVGYYVSSESDYFAQQLRADWNRDLRDGNLNLAFGTSYGWDEIDPLADDDTPDTAGLKTTWHWSGVVTQTLTRTTVVRLGAESSHVRGLQHNPYRNVYAGGARAVERHPGTRERRDLFLKANQYFGNRSSLRAQYVLYDDDWGIRAETLGARLSQYVTSNLVAEYRYRYYRQGRAEFFRDEYAELSGINGYRSGDYRLGRFDAHLFGGGLDLSLGRLATLPDALDPLGLRLSYERYFNSNGFSANILEAGLELPL